MYKVVILHEMFEWERDVLLGLTQKKREIESTSI